MVAQSAFNIQHLQTLQSYRCTIYDMVLFQKNRDFSSRFIAISSFSAAYTHFPAESPTVRILLPLPMP